MAAGLTGLSAAVDVLIGFEGELAPVFKALSVVTVVCAWLLLHLGHARYYAAWDHAEQAEGFHFPGTDSPGFVDHLYFAITIGVGVLTGR